MLLPILTAAQPAGVHPLSVSSRVPDIVFSNVINYKASAMKLSDFKVKLVILDFWSSWCTSCIALFPHLDSLQRRYKDSIQIILVNTKSAVSKDDAPKIKKILSRVQGVTGVSIGLPVVYNCPLLDKYFPCIIIPHEVWINSQGEVAGITFSNEVTAANIEGLLNGREVHMRLKRDDPGIDERKPLFINGNGGDGTETKYRSLVTGYIDGVAGGYGIRQENGSITGSYAINQTLYSLVKIAYGNKIVFTDNRVILDVKEKEKFTISYDDTAAYHDQYSYDLIVPPTNDSMLLIYMQGDLKRYFNISAKKEILKMKCLVLSVSGTPKPAPAGVKTDFDLEPNTLEKYISNYPPAEVTKLLNNYTHLPIIDETNITSNITIDLPYNINDISKLQQAFAAKGFNLSEEERMLEVVVINDQ